MYSFILNMYVFGRITEAQVKNYATKGFITEQEAQQILATPRN